ncbi:MAG: CAP domain-containing protein [Cellulomonadaceae bacterium]|nr:CAP domain-containing protein [Cellulomonadaceae bacterium]
MTAARSIDGTGTAGASGIAEASGSPAGRKRRLLPYAGVAAIVAGGTLVAFAFHAVTGSPEPSSHGALSGVGVVEPRDVDAYASGLVAATNAVRDADGLPALTVNDCAAAQALPRVHAIGPSGDLAHASLAAVFTACQPDGGIGGAIGTGGENLSRSAATPQAVVDAWMQSPSHRANLLDPAFTSVGVACMLITADQVDRSRMDAVEQMLCSQVFLGH